MNAALIGMTITEYWSLDVETAARLVEIHEIRHEVAEANRSAAALGRKER